MAKTDLLKLLCAAVLLGVATLLGWRFWRADAGPSDVTFFYDLSRQQLFKAPRTAVPPIRGVDGPDEDAVRAVVVSTNGNPGDRKSWKIAYLERYSPELKQQMEAAQTSGNSPAMGRGEAMRHRFVKRLTDANWSSMDSPEAEKILNEWAVPGPDGSVPVVCAP